MDKDEAKLKVLMDEDAEFSRLYREAYGDIKADKGYDYDEADRIHKKYAYLFEEGKLDNKHEGSDLYQLQNEKPTPEEEILSTELSDESLDLLYKRYKIMQTYNNTTMEDMENEAKELLQSFSAGNAKAMYDYGERSVRSYDEISN